MESNYHEESVNSSEEDQENIDLGVGRSYECVFCKRGFNTAQALGGHMNIHRKDRARNKPAQAANSSKGLNHQIIPPPPSSSYSHNNNIQSVAANHVRFPSHDHSHQLSNYAATYFPGPSSDYSDHRRPSDPGDWRMSLSLEFSPSKSMEDLEKKRSEIINQKEDLDLELRLGYE